MSIDITVVAVIGANQKLPFIVSSIVLRVGVNYMVIECFGVFKAYHTREAKRKPNTVEPALKATCI